MINKLSHVCLVVHDYDEAKQWYQDKLGFEVRADESYGPGMRWVTLGIKGQNDIEITLYKTTPEEKDPRLQKVGMTSGWVFGTDNCRADVERLKDKGVNIMMEPNDAPWGTQAVFEDLYGNVFVLVQPRKYTQEELQSYESTGWDATQK